MSLLMLVELLVVLIALWIGARYGSLALGAISGIGLAILVFCFHLKPSTPPTDVIYIIIAAVTCAGVLQASGGMDWMIQIAEKLLRKHPVLINSQGAVVVSMLPLAYSLKIEPWILLGVMPSVYGYFFIPNYPSDIATVNFDRSGTTVIGKYLLNHSFMAPGMIHVVTATIVGLGVSYVYHFWLGMY